MQWNFIDINMRTIDIYQHLFHSSHQDQYIMKNCLCLIVLI
jgi:hypothetical protein